MNALAHMCIGFGSENWKRLPTTNKLYRRRMVEADPCIPRCLYDFEKPIANKIRSNVSGWDCFRGPALNFVDFYKHHDDRYLRRTDRTDKADHKRREFI